MKKTPVEQVLILWWQTVWEKYSRKLTSPDQKRKIIPYKKEVSIGWNLIKATTCYSRNHSLKIVLNNSNKFAPATNVPPLVNILTTTWLRSESHSQPMSILTNFSLCSKGCTITSKPSSPFMDPQSLQFILFCLQKMILDQMFVIFSRILFLCCHFVFHWREEYPDLCRFWLWSYFLPWDSYKKQIDQPRTEIHFQILRKTQVQSQRRSSLLF